MIFKTIDYQVNNGIAQILLKRPDQLNAVNSLMSIELPEMWKKFNEDNAAIVAIISGFGDKSFCVGADLADLPNMDGDAGMASLESIKWTSLQNNIWKPVICAVNGMACGGGLHFVADSDIVIASDKPWNQLLSTRLALTIDIPVIHISDVNDFTFSAFVDIDHNPFYQVRKVLLQLMMQYLVVRQLLLNALP